MTIKDIIQSLVSKGSKISYKKRKDGGYLITRINGKRYTGASGNIKARQILGVKISEARGYQLGRLNRNRPKHREKREPLPEELVREMRKIQRKWRKTHKDISGTISMRGLRYQYEHYGKEKTLEVLDKAFRYSEGYAYVENVQALINQMELDLNKISDQSEVYEFETLIQEIQNKMMTFKEDWIHPIYAILYDMEKKAGVSGSISVKEAIRRIKSIIE